jgi:hypothetical protein
MQSFAIFLDKSRKSLKIEKTGDRGEEPARTAHLLEKNAMGGLING